MKYVKKHLSFILCFLIGLSGIYAQESINTSGGNNNGSGGSVSYSIGQPFCTSSFGANGSVAEGVQQPYEISVVIGIEHTDDISLQCSAFPNPANDYVKLKFSVPNSLANQSLIYQLFDINGKLIETKKIVDNDTDIEMANLLPATYFLKVLQDNKEIKIFKIIKN